ncbi:UDP-N-acetylmuramoyl-tripeptide--D-alanyl-D-alanine ligase [Dokdonia pacifica]|uniref:UDP-N-acetylmuramoyl-tripeptide--D-alanyl-D-alanine ligase n=1 Tax=Dokdonia pacifica TaxID=1627892 RepID=A0A239BMX8_9FLAO|nr:UDP-N-acetylmuramoyl-tripeptide--D-alanyl-D-alanine ligase [Dokdonia pacifica]GGG28782.1 UDP-N-acetylmuramoyl-tripeptide--D-alanyl-D-alanine ligase [Dokdonia pacifica]SNS08708.1 UDP-N-acetylmuramoyl-tripeptide--D-alanyl-D-alanine ligase [Dokdonia pacifica]
MNIEQLHHLFLQSTGVCTDTRKLEKGQLYFALKGANFNGNHFAKKAIDQGATYAIIDEKQENLDNAIIVEDVLQTLQELSTYHRLYLDIPIIALTGSNGKTTTKELINAVLSQKYSTTATVGNLNNHIGVPLTLLSMTKATEIGIVEMGANHQGEIAALSEIAQPNFGYITNFGKAHLEGFGGVEGVIKGKSELYKYIRKTNGIVFINKEDPIQIKQSAEIDSKTFAPHNADYSIAFKEASPYVQLACNNLTIQTQLTGAYNAINVAAAIAIGSYFSVNIEAIKLGIENYIPANNRSQIIKKENNNTIILDAYNANPTSMEAALNNLSKQTSKHKIAFLGDMFEVGETTNQEHQHILNYANSLAIDQVYAVGPTFGISTPENNTQHVFLTYNAFAKAYKKNIPSDTTILIKGSRGMAMERVLELIE